jgi:hypothetical protein
MSEVKTDPPPSVSHEARALRAIGAELDVVGDALGTLAAGVSGLQQLGEEDAVTLRGISRKLDKVLELLTDSLERTSRLEIWRGDHMREHAQAAE